METPTINKPLVSLTAPLGTAITGSPLFRYGCSIVITLAIAFLRLALHPLLQTRAPFGLFFLSIVFASWLAGFGPGLLSLAMGVGIGLYFADSPKSGLNLGLAEWVGLTNFVLTGILIVALNEKQRRAKSLVDANVQALHDKQTLLELKQAEVETLNTRLQRAMQETHHRVKNNLQVVSALAEMQMEPGQPTVPTTAIARIGTHVRALATIHDLLTQEAKQGHNDDILHAKTILDKLIPLVRATIGDREIRYTADDMTLSAKQGAALALLVNEMVSNALKHGRGAIGITLGVKADVARLEVCDEGAGFPPAFDSKRAANTGLELIDSVGRWDLGGTVAFENREQGGGRVVVTFPAVNPPHDA